MTSMLLCRSVEMDCEVIGSDRAGFLAALVFLVLPEGFFELVLEDDDPAGGFERDALVDHLSSPCGEAQLIAGVAAVSAGRAERGDQLRLVEPTQEVLRSAGDLRG